MSIAGSVGVIVGLADNLHRLAMWSIVDWLTPRHWVLLASVAAMLFLVVNEFIVWLKTRFEKIEKLVEERAKQSDNFAKERFGTLQDAIRREKDARTDAIEKHNERLIALEPEPTKPRIAGD